MVKNGFSRSYFLGRTDLRAFETKYFQMSRSSMAVCNSSMDWSPVSLFKTSIYVFFSFLCCHFLCIFLFIQICQDIECSDPGCKFLYVAIFKLFVCHVMCPAYIQCHSQRVRVYIPSKDFSATNFSFAILIF